MKKVIKNINSTTRLFLFLLCLLCATGCKKDEPSIASGTIGKLTWKLLDNGTLTISGTGEMPNYNYSSAPWQPNKELITAVVINNGITSIGGNAFYECSGLTYITIPYSVTSI